MDVTQLLKHPLSTSRLVAVRRAVRQFAHRFGLVYLGSVSQHETDTQLIVGVTVSNDHVDSNVCVGGYRGHDISLVERQNVLTFPDKPPKLYHWIIMQVDLRRGGLPHIFLDAHRHDQLFYATLFMKYRHLADAESVFARHDPLFVANFKPFMAADSFDNAERYLNPEVTAMLAHHFHQFDYEIDDDRVLVYAPNPSSVTPKLLQEMLRVGTWLADQLNAVSG